jgi:hypothetical protein
MVRDVLHSILDTPSPLVSLYIKAIGSDNTAVDENDYCNIIPKINEINYQ